MRRALVAAVLVALVGCGSASALESSDFRWTRALQAPGGGPIRFEPDPLLFAHSNGAGLSDLRVLDAVGEQVPWRFLPSDESRPPVELLNSGRQGAVAVALVDRGASPEPIDRIELTLADERFVGRVEVHGSDDRRAFTFLSSTPIYDIGGPRPARNTVAILPRTDFRYLRLRATGPSRIAGAVVSIGGTADETAIVSQPAWSERFTEGTTVVELDLRLAGVPVDELRLTSTTPRFDRTVEVAGSDDGLSYFTLARGRIFRFDGEAATAIPLQAEQRYLRVTIDNGDDRPLELVRVEAARRSRAVLVGGGHPGPLQLLYGNRGLGAPDYDFAQLPSGSLGLERVVRGRLGPERANESFEPTSDTRSFAARHPSLIQGALALTAFLLLAGGFLALRRRT